MVNDWSNFHIEIAFKVHIYEAEKCNKKVEYIHRIGV
jgi:hypothetical protein